MIQILFYLGFIILWWILAQWISVVQKAGLGTGAGVSSQGSGAFGSNTVAGNSLLGFACTGSTTTNRTVSSVTGGGTFGLAIHAIFTNKGTTASWGDIWIYLAKGIAGGSTTAVTFNLSGTVTDIDVGCLEVNGVDTTDQTNHNDNLANSSPATMTTGSITPSQANSLILAVANTSGTVTWGTEPTGFTNQLRDTGATFEACSADTNILSSASAQNPSYAFTFSGGGTNGACACIASFVLGGATPQKPVLASQEVTWPMHQEQSLRYRRKLWPIPELVIAKSKIVLGRADQLERLRRVA